LGEVGRDRQQHARVLVVAGRREWLWWREAQRLGVRTRRKTARLLLATGLLPSRVARAKECPGYFDKDPPAPIKARLYKPCRSLLPLFSRPSCLLPLSCSHLLPTPRLPAPPRHNGRYSPAAHCHRLSGLGLVSQERLVSRRRQVHASDHARVRKVDAHRWPR